MPCLECGGNGSYIGNIESVNLKKFMRNYDELLDLQKDAKRVIKQAAQLCEMKPERGECYNEQLRVTLLVINRQAERAAERKSNSHRE